MWSVILFLMAGLTLVYSPYIVSAFATRFIISKGKHRINAPKHEGFYRAYNGPYRARHRNYSFAR